LKIGGRGERRQEAVGNEGLSESVGKGPGRKERVMGKPDRWWTYSASQGGALKKIPDRGKNQKTRLFIKRHRSFSSAFIQKQREGRYHI